jgi:enamine deaminase RidA (YjgF/YER057c/UK114 family)
MLATAENRLRQLGIELPPPSPPLASYAPVVIVGRTAFVSGHGPLADGRPRYSGRIGDDLSDDEARDAARLTVTNLLATLRNGVGTLDNIERIIELRCFLLVAADSNAHRFVPEAALEMLKQIFGQRAAACALTTVGVSACVLNLPVTIDLLTELTD